VCITCYIILLCCKVLCVIGCKRVIEIVFFCFLFLFDNILTVIVSDVSMCVCPTHSHTIIMQRCRFAFECGNVGPVDNKAAAAAAATVIIKYTSFGLI